MPHLDVCNAVVDFIVQLYKLVEACLYTAEGRIKLWKPAWQTWPCMQACWNTKCTLKRPKHNDQLLVRICERREGCPGISAYCVCWSSMYSRPKSSGSRLNFDVSIVESIALLALQPMLLSAARCL